MYTVQENKNGSTQTTKERMKTIKQMKKHAQTNKQHGVLMQRRSKHEGVRRQHVTVTLILMSQSRTENWNVFVRKVRRRMRKKTAFRVSLAQWRWHNGKVIRENLNRIKYIGCVIYWISCGAFFFVRFAYGNFYFLRHLNGKLGHTMETKWNQNPKPNRIKKSKNNVWISKIVLFLYELRYVFPMWQSDIFGSLKE